MTVRLFPFRSLEPSENSGQRTGHKTLVSSEKIMTIIMCPVWKCREKFKHTNSIYTKICQMWSNWHWSSTFSGVILVKSCDVLQHTTTYHLQKGTTGTASSSLVCFGGNVRKWFWGCKDTILRWFTWSLHRQQKLKIRSCWVDSLAEVSEPFKSTPKLRRLSSLSPDIADQDRRGLTYDPIVSVDRQLQRKVSGWCHTSHKALQTEEDSKLNPALIPECELVCMYVCVCMHACTHVRNYEHVLVCVTMSLC